VPIADWNVERKKEDGMLRRFLAKKVLAVFVGCLLLVGGAAIANAASSDGPDDPADTEEVVLDDSTPETEVDAIENDGPEDGAVDDDQGENENSDDAAVDDSDDAAVDDDQGENEDSDDAAVDDDQGENDNDQGENDDDQGENDDDQGENDDDQGDGDVVEED
jgi:hypothetical protein